MKILIIQKNEEIQKIKNIMMNFLQTEINL